MHLDELTTPALLIDEAALERNLDTMAAAWPGPRLRPHVKAHKSTELARRQAQHGHRGFTAATIREVAGMAAAGLGEDLLLANEVVDLSPLTPVVESGARVTVAVDSEVIARAAAAAGIGEVLVDVNVGLPRCGCPPEDAGRLAELCRSLGLSVRGVMGYEGHLMSVTDPAERAPQTDECMDRLRIAHDLVGGDVISGGGTGTWRTNHYVTELQAGSYPLMDTAYAGLSDVPFEQSLTILATVISVSQGGWLVADAGLKALSLDHGNPSIAGAQVLFCSDEHVVFVMNDGVSTPEVGDRIRVLPSHVDPTCALHESFHVVDDAGAVIDEWPIDLRGW